MKIFRFDASGCNGCDIEILSTAMNPEYGLSGIEIVDSPEDANAMIVTGGGNEKTAPLLKDAYERLQEPRTVIAMGACASSLCVFKRGYSMKGPVDTLIPVSFFVMGCPPRPQNLARAVHAVLEDAGDYSEPLWAGPEGLRARISHDREKCTACGACANMCPCEAIDLVEEQDTFKISYNLWKCSFCGTCQSVCPEDAVELTSDYELWSREKECIAETGEMPRAVCSVCGGFMHTRNQMDAIRARILENGEMAGLEDKIDSSIAVCERCKHTIGQVGKARDGMVFWAYD